MSNVLIVDDAAFIRFTLRTMLEKNGFKVICEAQNGVEAVKKYKENKPDIVTMDITMPEMSGIEALREIKQHDPKACVVIVSALGQESVVREAILCGARTFIIKPFKEEFVINTLKKVAPIQP